MLEERIVELKKEVTMFAAHNKEMLSRAIDGLVNRKDENLNKIINEDESLANEKELNIDHLCTTLIAQYQPNATNLRIILMASKINNDLERMADHVCNIAQSAKLLITQPPVKPLVDIPNMTEIAIGMQQDAINAFVKDDTELARDILARDKQVNNLRDQVLRELITYMTDHSSTIERSLHLIRIASNLERIADLATNIAEDIVFIVDGLVIKHPGVNK